jgi:hypothetical protein
MEDINEIFKICDLIDDFNNKKKLYKKFNLIFKNALALLIIHPTAAFIE